MSCRQRRKWNIGSKALIDNDRKILSSLDCVVSRELWWFIKIFKTKQAVLHTHINSSRRIKGTVRFGRERHNNGPRREKIWNYRRRQQFDTVKFHPLRLALGFTSKRSENVQCGRRRYVNKITEFHFQTTTLNTRSDTRAWTMTIPTKMSPFGGIRYDFQSVSRGNYRTAPCPLMLKSPALSNPKIACSHREAIDMSPSSRQRELLRM